MIYRAIRTSRENLPEILAGCNANHFHEIGLKEISSAELARDEIFVGFFGADVFDPNPDFIVCNPDSYSDFVAWLAAFLPGHSPISQWCRVWRSNDFAMLTNAKAKPFLAHSLAAWTGAIMAELSAERGGGSLADVTGLSAMRTGTFCAARATALWSIFDQYDELAKRLTTISGSDQQFWKSYDEISALWYVLCGDTWLTKLPNRASGFDELRMLFRSSNGMETIEPDSIQGAARHFGNHFRTPDLVHCSIGPQSRRVDALDKVASQLAAASIKAHSNVILGFAASLIDPGAAVMPALLKQYSQEFPVAQIWAGAFAGIWSPARVLGEQGGLGRIVAKEILAPTDLFSKPTADIAFAEFERWRGNSSSRDIGLRGASPRITVVELLPGISIPLSISRVEPTRDNRASASGGRQQTFDLEGDKNRLPSAEEKTATPISLEGLARRLRDLEQKVESISAKTARPTTGSKKRL
ncbi:hypothetical protein [Novosphingobium sp. MD-1]|uniref:hypothetical protein n=1 Tax=Novosphingobium sp. MD-1 TaxID=1630648 RepID=UPI00061C114B|nr:hypothetical protein [Novosphingobium sp. MD-1]GAO56848.1 hypothetical protein NMD1_04017 [Novosphingobium sp. MD-1]